MSTSCISDVDVGVDESESATTEAAANVQETENAEEEGDEEPESSGSPGVKRVEEVEKELAALLHSSDPHVMETQRRVTAVFGVFDRNSQKIIDLRDVGCIIRSLGLFPTESDVHEIIQAIEEPSPQGFVKYERFLPYVVRILLDGNRFKPPSTEMVRRAFKTFDKDKEGCIEPNELRQILTKQGEKFSQEEADKFFKFATSPDDNKVHWELYMSKLNFD